MSTIDCKEIIKDLLTNDGIFADDPQVYAIYEYTNNWNNKTHYVCNNDIEEFRMKMGACHNPELLWAVNLGLTDKGKEWLNENFTIDSGAARTGRVQERPS